MRRAASKRLRREAQRLFETVFKNRTPPPPRQSERKNAGTNKHDKYLSHGARVTKATAAFIEKYGEGSTRDAITDEIVSFMDDEVFEGVYKHLLSAGQRRKILRTKLVLKAKFSPIGEFEKIRARICAGGDAEDKETFLSLYSPTTSNEPALATLAIAAYEGRIAKIIDLQTAYLKVEVLDGSETFVKLNELESEILVSKYPAHAKYLGKDGCILAKLKKSLYGIVQASGNLYRKIRQVLTSKMRLTINPIDACTFNYVKDGRRLSVCLYVDDLLITWAQHFLEYQGYENLPPAQVREDNKATIANLEIGAPTSGNSRHYEVRYFYLSDLEQRGVIKVKHLSTNEMTADLLTKGLPLAIFSLLSEKLKSSSSDLNDPRATARSASP